MSGNLNELRHHPPAPRRPRGARLRDPADVLQGHLGPDRGRHRRQPVLPRRRGLAGAVRHPAAQVRRQAARPDLLRRRPTPPPSTRSPRSSAAEGVQLVGEPGELQTAGGGYGFRFFDIDGRTIEISSRRRDPPAPRDRGGRGDPGPHLARGDEHQRPEPHPRLLREHPRLQALGHALGRAHGRDDALHAVQRLAPQPGDRARPAHLGPPRVVRDARPRRVHARHRPGDARRHQEDLGTGPPQRRQQHVLLLPRPERQHDGVHDRAREDRDRPVAPERLRHRRPDDPGPVGHRGPDVARSSPATPSTTPTRASSSPRRSDGPRQLDGKVVVVTGGARGQGAAEVAALAARGRDGGGHRRARRGGHHAGQDAGGGRPRVEYVHLDVTDPDGWAALADVAAAPSTAGSTRWSTTPASPPASGCPHVVARRLAADLRHQRHRPAARHPGAGAADAGRARRSSTSARSRRWPATRRRRTPPASGRCAA